VIEPHLDGNGKVPSAGLNDGKAKTRKYKGSERADLCQLTSEDTSA
jgi:hypothetical protein